MKHPPNIHQCALLLAARAYEKTNGRCTGLPVVAPTTQIAKALVTKQLATAQVVPSERGSGALRVTLTPMGRELADRMVTATEGLLEAIYAESQTQSALWASAPST